jgi:hypothetical protein
MANTVQIKRYALEASIPASGYLPGEFMMAINTQKVFVALNANTRLELANNSLLANYLLKANNLSDLTDIAAARTNLDVYSKGQVDNLIAGINWKPDVLVVTLGNIALTGLQTIDGVTVPAGARIGVVKQTNATENGIYIAGAGSWSRANDANTAIELAGATFAVAQGTTMAETIWRVYTDNITPGTTSIEIQPFNGIKALVAGMGIKFINGNEVELDLTELSGNFSGLDPVNDEVVIIDVSASGTNKMRRIKVTQLLADAGMVSDTYKVMNMAGSTPAYLDDVLQTSEGVRKESSPAGMQIKMAINDLTAETSTQPTADVLVMYDNSAGGHRKITIQKAVENVAIDCGSY